MYAFMRFETYGQMHATSTTTHTSHSHVKTWSPPTDNRFLTSSQTISVQAGPSCSFKVQPRPPFAPPSLSLPLGPPFLLLSAVPSTEGQDDATVELNKELPRRESCAREACPVGRLEQPHRGGGCALASVGAAVGLLERTEVRPRALAARASSTDPSFPTTSAPAALRSRTTKKAALMIFASRLPLLRMVSARACGQLLLLLLVVAADVWKNFDRRAWSQRSPVPR